MEDKKIIYKAKKINKLSPNAPSDDCIDTEIEKGKTEEIPQFKAKIINSPNK
jgi:hypothetical protein